MYTNKKRLFAMKKHSSAFTVIELLVVIAIIGILASIIIAFLSSQSDKANDKKITQQVSSMRSQASLFTDTLPGGVAPSIAPVVGTTSGGLFADSDVTTNSLFNLIGTLPSGTSYFYAWDGENPSITSKWYFVATLSNGTVCTDWSGAVKIGETPFLVAPTSTGDWTPFVDVPSYTCL